MRKWLLAVLGVAVCGCAYSVKVRPVPGARQLAPSVTVAVVPAPPRDAILVGEVIAQGNNWQGAGSCEAELLAGARRLGGSHLVPTPPERRGGKGPRCTAAVYWVER